MCPEFDKCPRSEGEKFCPICDSTEIFFASGLPQMWSIWECRNCGYMGPIVIEDSEIGKKLREDWKRGHASST